jgi:hypothetical protein
MARRFSPAIRTQLEALLTELTTFRGHAQQDAIDFLQGYFLNRRPLRREDTFCEVADILPDKHMELFRRIARIAFPHPGSVTAMHTLNHGTAFGFTANKTKWVFLKRSIIWKLNGVPEEVDDYDSGNDTEEDGEYDDSWAGDYATARDLTAILQSIHKRVAALEKLAIL